MLELPIILLVILSMGGHKESEFFSQYYVVISFCVFIRIPTYALSSLSVFP